MPEPGRQRRLLILAICCLSLFIVGVDNTIVNVALPSIQRDLHAPVSGLQWTVDAYTVVMASFLILAGSTARRAVSMTSTGCSGSRRASRAASGRRSTPSARQHSSSPAG